MRTTSTLFITLLLSACGSEVTLTNNPRNAEAPDGEDTRPDDTEPPVAVCGADPRVIEPGDTLDLVGGNSYDPDDIPIVSYRWEMRVKPEGSAVRMDDPSAANIVELQPDLIGEYNALLVVRNDRGTESIPCDADFKVEPADRLYVQMRPAYGADDIELRISRNDETCVAIDCLLDWGEIGDTIDDPFVLFDDSTGASEVIAIEDPAPGTYTITAYDRPASFRDRDNAVEIVIYADGQEAWRGTKTFSFEAQTKRYAEVVVTQTGQIRVSDL